MRIQAQDLQALLKPAFAVANQKSPIPIVGAVRLRSEGGILLVEANNLDEAYRGFTKAISLEAGESLDVGINEQQFKMISKIKKDVVLELRQNGSGLNFQAGTLKSDMTFIAGEEFPEMPSQSKQVEVSTLRISDLLNALAVASDSEARPQMCGVFLQAQTGNVAATDGHRLRLVEGAFTPNKLNQDVIMPRSTVKLAASVFGKDAEVSLWTLNDDREIRFALIGDTHTLLWRRVDAEYPRIEQVIPRNQPYCVTLDLANLTETLDVYLGMAGSRSNSRFSSVSFDSVDGNIQLKYFNSDIGDFTQTLESGNEAQIENALGLNGFYFKDVLASFPKKGTLKLEFTDHLAPVVFRVEGYSHFDLLMPLRV